MEQDGIFVSERRECIDMAGMMRDRHLGFVHYKEINPPTLPRISGRYLDRWVRIWEDAYKKGTPFELSARDLGEFWLLDQFFTVGIRGYVQSKAGIWLSEGPVSYLESAVFLASRARHPDHIHNLDVRREMIFRNLREWLRGWPADAMQQLGKRAAIYRADLADSLFDVAHGMLAGDIPGAGTLRKVNPVPPVGWERRFGRAFPGGGPV